MKACIPQTLAPGSNIWFWFRFGGPGTIRRLNLSSWPGCISDGTIDTQVPGSAQRPSLTTSFDGLSSEEIRRTPIDYFPAEPIGPWHASIEASSGLIQALTSIGNEFGPGCRRGGSGPRRYNLPGRAGEGSIETRNTPNAICKLRDPHAGRARA